MSDQHTQIYGKCAIPGAVGDSDGCDDQFASSGSQVVINGPPASRRCSICRRHTSDLQPFGGPGDPLVGDFSNMKLVKRWREDLPGYVSSSWECRDCIVRTGGIWEIEAENELGRELSLEERRRMRADIERELDAMHQEPDQ